MDRAPSTKASVISWALMPRRLEMIHDSRFPRVSVRTGTAPENAQAKLSRPERNRPATIDEFDHEHMGIAAKE